MQGLGPVAHLVERLHGMEEVARSIRVGSTIVHMFDSPIPLGTGESSLPGGALSFGAAGSNQVVRATVHPMRHARNDRYRQR